MPEIKPNYTELTHQVVRESAEPLPFKEILQRVNDLAKITTKSPKNTIRNAIGQSRLIVNTGGGRYGWKYRVINGSVIRLPLTETDRSRQRVSYSDELRDALWPAFFEGQKRSDRSPIQLQLPDGTTCDWTLEFFGESDWGTTSSSKFWGWLNSIDAQPGDDLIFRVIDGEARQYGVEIQKHSDRDEGAIAERNRQILQVVQTYNQRSHFEVLIWDIASHLLATGQYKHPVPPDPLEQILKDELWGPDLPFETDQAGWMLKKKPEIDPLIESLLDQIGDTLPRQRSRKKQPPEAAVGRIYQLKVTLGNIHPPIWRRIQVQDDMTLPRLHAVLQIALDWTNSHLHGFKANGQFYSEPSPDYYDLDVIDEGQVRLSQIAPEIGSRFIYEYDFGDSWNHELVVEEILTPQKGVEYPRCMDGKRSRPPEDVGGAWGYEEFLKAIRDRRHPEHDEYLQWVGGKFDPEAFNLQRANELLHSFQLAVEKG